MTSSPVGTPRTRRRPRAVAWVALAQVALASAGCRTDDGAGGGRADFPPAEERAPLVSDVVEVASSPPEADFSYVVALDVDSRGNVYVGDWNAKTVTVLSPSGEVVRTVGRSGAGPGEFGSVSDVEILPGDSLQVYDIRLARLTVFEPGTDVVAYTLNLSAPGQSAFPYSVQRTRDGARLVAAYQNAFMAGAAPREDVRRTEVLKLLGTDGAVQKDSVLVFPAPVSLVLRAGGGVAVNSDPFGRKGIAKVGSDDRIYYAWTDSARVRIHSLEGDSVAGFTVPHVPPPVTPADLDRAAGRMKPAFRRPLEDAAPDRWPPFRQMVVDGEGRIWIGLAAPSGQPVEWAAFSEEGRYLGSATLPADALLWLARGDHLYAVATDDLDVPRVATYRLARPLQGSVARR